MGSTELALIVKFGLPIAARIFDNDSKILPIDAAEQAIAEVEALRKNLKNADEILLAADEAQTQGIIDGLFSFATGVVGAPVALIATFLGLFGGKNDSQI